LRGDGFEGIGPDLAGIGRGVLNLCRGLEGDESKFSAGSHGASYQDGIWMYLKDWKINAVL